MDKANGKTKTRAADVKVSVNEVNKLNESYEAITVTPEGSNIGVNMSLEKSWIWINAGKSEIVC